MSMPPSSNTLKGPMRTRSSPIPVGPYWPLPSDPWVISSSFLMASSAVSGIGDDRVRIGPFKVLLDGGMLIGTAYMREPWGTGDTYQITDPAYRGILNVKPEVLN